MLWISASHLTFAVTIALCGQGESTMDGALPHGSLYRRVEEFLNTLTIPQGYYELHAISVEPPHGRTLEIAEQHRTLPAYHALRRLGEQHLREGQTYERKYAVWFDGRRLAAKSILDSLNGNLGRYEKTLNWEGLNDEYHWQMAGGPTLVIQSTDAQPAPWQFYDAKQKLWGLLTCGFSHGPPALRNLSSVEPVMDAAGHIAQVKAILVSPDGPSKYRVCTIECDPPGQPARIISVRRQWGSEREVTNYGVSDWREVASSLKIPFHLDWHTVSGDDEFDATIELLTYRPLDISDEDAFYPPAASTPNEMTGKPLYEWIEDRRQTPPLRISAQDPKALTASGLKIPPNANIRIQSITILVAATIALASFILWTVRRRRLNRASRQ